jgi:hypothetical protein
MMKMRNAARLLQTIALLAFARRIGLRRGGKLLALSTAALLDQQSKRRRTRGNEAPMVIGPRDVARLLRQLLTTLRGTKK